MSRRIRNCLPRRPFKGIRPIRDYFDAKITKDLVGKYLIVPNRQKTRSSREIETMFEEKTESFRVLWKIVTAHANGNGVGVIPVAGIHNSPQDWIKSIRRDEHSTGIRYWLVLSENQARKVWGTMRHIYQKPNV